MKPKHRRRLDALEARMEALEGARPTVELVEWSRIPDGEPLDVHAIMDAITARHAYGWSEDEWRSGYL